MDHSIGPPGLQPVLGADVRRRALSRPRVALARRRPQRARRQRDGRLRVRGEAQRPVIVF
jgi:hypothetical protein